MIYGILPHKYDIICGIFPKYLQKIKKNQQHLHKFSILHGSIVEYSVNIFKKQNNVSDISFISY